MRKLSVKQAQTCENATHPRCRCRCGGEFHGARRLGAAVPDRAAFMSLPVSDPHHLPPAEEAPEEEALVALARARRARRRALEEP